jgi:hypothetical protein
MGIVFVEYKVFPEKREAYLSRIRKLLKTASGVQLYEGSDQPNLFVEIWQDCDAAQYRKIKQLRLQPGSAWAEIADFVPGGASRIHIWHFDRTL